MLDQLKDWAGQKINGTQINLDLQNSCCLACPSCAVGSIATKRKGVMSFDTFRKILDKAESEMSKIRRVQLYVYSDPCMHKDLHLFVQELTDRGVDSWISTMMQVTNCDFAKVIDARPTEFRISYPGLSQMRYYQSKAADPERFMRKFEEVAKLPRHKETTWNVFFHHYNDNTDEKWQAEALAKQHNMGFVSIWSIFMVLEKFVRHDYSEADLALISRLWETPEEATARMRRTKTCVLHKQLTLDANADVYLCQLIYADEFKLTHYLTTPWSAIQKMMKTHPFCGECLAKGGNQYQLCYEAPDKYKDPQIGADKKRRTW